MPNRLKLTGILTPSSDDAFRPGVGYVKFEPADDRAATWAVPGYRPAWPVLGVPNAVGGALQEINGGDVYVPGDEPGDAHAGPWMRVSYELQTTAGTWHRGTYLWRAVSTGGGVIDIRTPAPEQEPPIVARPGVPAGALLTTDVDNLVPSMAAFRGATTPLQPAGVLSYIQYAGTSGVFTGWSTEYLLSTPHMVIGQGAFEFTPNDTGFSWIRVAPPEGWTIILNAMNSATLSTDGLPQRAAGTSQRDTVALNCVAGVKQSVVIGFIMVPV